MTSSHVRRLQSRVARTAARFVDHATRHQLDASALPAVRLPWFEVRDAAEATTDAEDTGPATAEVLIFDEVGGSFGIDASALVEDLAALSADTIRVRINSPGGSVFDAIAIYNALNHHDARIEVYVDALAASAASIIAMAGDEVVMMPGSQMMIHDASTVVDGQSGDVAKIALLLDRQSNNIADLYRQRAGGGVAQWRALMLAETWMFAEEAVEAKLADRVERAPRAKASDKRMARAFDLSAFRYEGRSAAPTPDFRYDAEGRLTALSPALEARTAALVGRPAQQSGRRFGTLSHVEVRTNADGSVHVEGHAGVFDTPTEIGAGPAGFEERVAPGAFAKTIRDNADVRFLFNHNPDLVLARTKSGTLSLREDTRGLAITADLAPTSVGRDLAILLGRGDISEMSFGFQAIQDVWTMETRDDGSRYELRTILEARLFDVSAVTFPAYDNTDIAVREAQLARELRAVPRTKRPQQPPSGTVATPTEDPAPGGTATSPEPTSVTPEIEERSLPLHELLLRHASGAHTAAPRALCPACTREPAAV